MVTDEEVEERKADREGWTRVKKKDGSKGLVPTAFLKGRSSEQMNDIK